MIRAARPEAAFPFGSLRMIEVLHRQGFFEEKDPIVLLE